MALTLDYYSDVLCVWAWIAQRRNDELSKNLQQSIEIRHHFVDVFGDVATKMATQWKDRGGYDGFAEHVRTSAAPFEYAPVNSKLWTQVRPATSANAHLVLKAVSLEYDQQISVSLELLVRKAFFIDAANIADMGVLLELAQEQGLEPKALLARVYSGEAMAALLQDYQRAKLQGLKGSPTYVLDGGRQTLYGNVGYRVLMANIEELLKSPTHEASWC